ncbi:3-deoxy-D-manno-octulosonic acid transferase [Shimia aestuarii]|uniref:3-deoxy-D-manno-octulosonic acid transferase n=1 Tax=Shimia aestuarii TaxID=254406 RepID=UPI001FB1E0C2|nr:3-deoxy-D-manno-octulosonic acid transferase [Shimia aestuarii]
MAAPALTLTYRLYQALTALGAPLAMREARKRFVETNGPLDRLSERAGRTSVARPEGRLVWIHAVSVGEFRSILGLVDRLVADGVHVLVTTTTATSATLAAERLPDGALHQFSPLDTPQATRRFLDHWRPDLVAFVESEIWPNQIVAAHRRGLPLVLLNARLSARSLKRWQKLSATAESLFARFSLILCQVKGTEQALALLGADAMVTSTTGDLKADADALPIDPDEAARLSALIGDRPLWVAASTHEGEEEQVSAAHRIVTGTSRESLLILVPRHPERANAIAHQLAEEGWQIARRSAGQDPGPDTQIYLADTLGETGLWYHLAPVVFVAGSFAPVGGHNPYEPAHFGCAILHGPLYANFALAYGEMTRRDACLEVEDATALGLTVAGLFQTPRLAPLQDNARAYVTSAKNLQDDIAARLRALIEA